MQPTFTKIDYTYVRPGTQLGVFNLEDLPLQFSKVPEKQILHFHPGDWGGNHKHPRTEWFVTFGDGAVIFWLDDGGSLQSRKMNPNGVLYLVEVPPFLPHAVKNMSSSELAVILELADGKQVDVEKVEVIT